MSLNDIYLFLVHPLMLYINTEIYVLISVFSVNMTIVHHIICYIHTNFVYLLYFMCTNSGRCSHENSLSPCKYVSNNLWM